MTDDERNAMTESAKKAAELKADETEQVVDDGPSDATPAKLTDKFGRVTDQREFGDVHEYSFDDGTSAKVWTGDNKTHVSVLLRGVNGRGLSTGLHEDVLIGEANRLIESAGQSAADAVKAADKVN